MLRALTKVLIIAAVAAAILSPACPVHADTWRAADGPLMTRWAREVSPTNALPEYPRPQLVRATWQNLNGLWDYAISEAARDSAPSNYTAKILVPYPIESALSGVMKPLLPTQRLWYHRGFTVPASWAGQCVLLHFGAVDWETRVRVNGRDLGSHRGGYDEFSFDITNAVHPGENDIVVDVADPTDTGRQLRGKQTLHPGGAAYTAVSGIWRTVWLEAAPPSHVESLHIVTDASDGAIHLTVGARIDPRPTPFTVTVTDGATEVARVTETLGAEMTPEVRADLEWYKATSTWTQKTVDIQIPHAHLWSPDDPFLYQLRVDLHPSASGGDDSVASYAGIRTLSVAHDAKGNTRLHLNGKLTMLPMVLDQGYWPDGIYTAPTDEALRFDLEAEKKLGLFPRKHIKIEPERWYYWADKLGVLVLQDLPTGNEGDAQTDRPTSPDAAAQCETEMRTLIQQRWNHPCIISWDMFNEGWGQHDTVATAAWAKALDPTRLIDEASGFPWHGAGDIRDCHGGIPAKSATAISIDTEDGSVGLRTPGHDWPIGDLWTPVSYNPTTDADDSHPVAGKFAILTDPAKAWFTHRVRSMFHALWSNMDETGQTGDSYCQIVDVETKEDGLLSYDRAVWKVDPAPIRIAARGEEHTRNVAFVLPTALVQSTRWKYTTKAPVDGWMTPAFDDTSWASGQSAFGGGYDHIGTPWTATPGEIWLRKQFTLASKPVAPLIRMIHDEDVEVYLNGARACHAGGYISSYDDFDIDSKASATLKPGKNLIAVHCRQTTGGQVIDVGIVDAK